MEGRVWGDGMDDFFFQRGEGMGRASRRAVALRSTTHLINFLFFSLSLWVFITQRKEEKEDNIQMTKKKKNPTRFP